MIPLQKQDIKIIASEKTEDPDKTEEVKEIAPQKKIEKEKKVPIAPTKQYYTVTIEGSAPVTVSYRVLAENPEQALELTKNAPLAGPPRPQLSRLKKQKATVHLSGTTIIKLTCNFIK